MVEVRSVVLGSGVTSGPKISIVVRCPPDLTLLVKRIDLWNPYTDTTAKMWATRGSQAVSVAFFSGPVPFNTVTAWEGWLVLMPDDLVQLTAEGGVGLYYWISGAALHGVETVYQPEPSPGTLPYVPGLVPDSGGEPKSL